MSDHQQRNMPLDRTSAARRKALREGFVVIEEVHTPARDGEARELIDALIRSGRTERDPDTGPGNE